MRRRILLASLAVIAGCIDDAPLSPDPAESDSSSADLDAASLDAAPPQRDAEGDVALPDASPGMPDMGSAPMPDAAFVPDVQRPDASLGPAPTRWASLGFRPHDGGCGITAERRLLCWGWGAPEPVTPLEGEFAQVSGSPQYGCVLDPAGSPHCWNTLPALPLALPEGRYTGVSVGGTHSPRYAQDRIALIACGVRDTGELACWGDYVNPDDQMVPATPPPGRFVLVDVGRNFACAIDLEGTIHCWGARSIGVPLTPPPPGRFTALALGDNAACAVRIDGEILCWMRRDGSAELSPVPPGPFEDVMVSGIGTTMCGLRPDGSVTCWGGHYYPIAERGYELPPDPLRDLQGSDSLICGLRRADDTLVCWGHGAAVVPLPP